jgi:hypothetical protein
VTNAHYTHLSWYRTGLATAIASTAEDMRGVIEVKLTARFTALDEEQAAHAVRLIGPGDILGLEARAVVRTDPRPLANDFEPSNLAAIDLFEEDLPWRYSPKVPDGARLLPWLALVVLADGEYRLFPQGEGLPRVLEVFDAAVLPPADQAWAWAHTALHAEHANPADPQATAALLAADPAASCSRLIAGRKLRAGMSYRAFLVPTFEVGRQAGLPNEAARADALAWPRAEAIKLPVYYEWSFRTGEEGAFEALVRRLQPLPAPPRIGRTPMDVSAPLPAMATPPIVNLQQPAQPVLDLEGALQVPKAQPSDWEPGSRAAFADWLAGFIALGDAWTLKPTRQLDTSAPQLPEGTRLPIILPPAYGRWHANIETLDPAQAQGRWPEQLNLDPRQRVAAAFGTLVVQKNQEDFVARAWQQYGELFAANRTRARAQFMAEMLTMSQAKHLAPLAPAALMGVTSLAHARVPLATTPGAAPRTLRAEVHASTLGAAGLAPALRRMLRPGGAIAKRLGTRSAPLHDLVTAVASGQLALAPPWLAPEERLSLTHQPASLGADRSLRLGESFDELVPLIRQLIRLLRALAPRHPVCNEIADYLEKLLLRGGSAPLLGAEGMTQAGVATIAARPDWVPSVSAAAVFSEQDRAPSPEQRAFSSIAWNVRQALLNATGVLSVPVPAAASRPTLDLAATTAHVQEALRPARSVRERVSALFHVPQALQFAAYDPLEPIMAHPRFDDATYASLKAIAQEHVVPNLATLANNSVTLLESNWRFIESYLVGMNHEMARELLWRGYPTDQRGTYFPQFWDLLGVPGAHDAQGRIRPERNDIAPIHGWKLGGKLKPLGGNRPAGRQVEANLVLVVRGDVFRRYPNTEVYAVKAVANPGPRDATSTFGNFSRRAAADTAATRKDPILHAHFEPDIHCFGFDIEADEARGNAANTAAPQGWYFVLAERFGEPRFGLDDPPDNFGQAPLPRATTVTDLSWAHLVDSPQALAALGALDLTTLRSPGTLALDSPKGKVRWPQNDTAVGAGEFAAILMQTPFRMYFHANDMLGAP